MDNPSTSSSEKIKLTSLSSCAGCASKLSAETLSQVLQRVGSVFNSKDYPNLLVGINSPDDAAVWKIDDTRALVMTTDFFTPIVDDPYDYGAIAAANAISDIFAMGGKPFMALNIAALPADLPDEIISEILRGGAEKAREAGTVIAGGHTVQDKEPKYGLAVIGFVEINQLMTKKGLQPGDHLLISKPMGFGVTTTALKRQTARSDDISEVITWMKRLNRDAASLANRFEVRTATDVTGFSLIGHTWEMASQSRVKCSIEFDRIPFVHGAHHYAESGTFPGGAFNNLSFFGSHVKFNKNLEEPSRMLLFDPQTSGGLLMGVPGPKVQEIMTAARDIDQPLWDIGLVEPGEGIVIY